MRGPMVAAQTAAKVEDLRRASKTVTELPEYASGTLTKEQRKHLVSGDWETFVDNYFARFGYVFPAAPGSDRTGYDLSRHCGHCLTVAMADTIYESGYISDEDVRTAFDARRAWQRKRMEKELAKRK